MSLSWTMIHLLEMSPTILPRKPPGVEGLPTSSIWRLLTGFRRGKSLQRRLLRGPQEDQSPNGLPKVLHQPRNGLIPGFFRQLPLSKEHLRLLPGERGRTPLARATFPKRKVHVPLLQQSAPPRQETRNRLPMRNPATPRSSMPGRNALGRPGKNQPQSVERSTILQLLSRQPRRTWVSFNCQFLPWLPLGLGSQVLKTKQLVESTTSTSKRSRTPSRTTLGDLSFEHRSLFGLLQLKSRLPIRLS